MLKSDFTYRQPTLLTRTLQGLLIIQILSALTIAIVLFVGAGTPVLMPQPLFQAYKICSLIPVFIWLPLLIILMFWVYRINKNTHTLTRKALEFSPGWAVGWWFVPFASLVQPLRVVAELYNANANPENWHSKIPIIIAAWWALVIIGSLAGMASSAALADGVIMPFFVSGGLMAILAVHQTMALIIYTRIARWQKKSKTSPGIEEVF